MARTSKVARCLRLQPIEGTTNPLTAPIQHMGVDHGGGDIGVSE